MVTYKSFKKWPAAEMESPLKNYSPPKPREANGFDVKSPYLHKLFPHHFFENRGAEGIE